MVPKQLIVMIGLFLLGACQTAPPARKGSSAPSVGSAPTASFRPFPVYKNRPPRRSHFSPSGYMGDSDLAMSGAYTTTRHGQGPCLRIIYKGGGSKGWAGVYWQDPANNWGDVPGKAGFDLRGATKLTFWARGENGGEKIHEFRIGGIVGQYPDSDVAMISSVRLSNDWKQYSIDLSKKDLRHIIGGFGFFVNKFENPDGIVFYLDDIVYEGPEGATAIEEPPTPAVSTVTAVTPPVPEQKPAPVATELPAPELPASATDLRVKSTETGLRVSFSSQLHFVPGRATLGSGSGKVLDQLIALLSAYPTNPVLVEGHTDSTGNADYNLKLSRLRAAAVRDYLIKQGGYEDSRFKVVGYGDTRPVGDNTTKAGRSLNRRVEVTILKKT